MILRTIFVSALAVFSITLATACAHDVASQAAEEDTLKKEYNDKIAQTEVIEHDLAKNHHVFIGVGNEDDTLSRALWIGSSAQERDLVKHELQRYLELIGRLIELADHKALNQDVPTHTKLEFRDDRDSAQAHLKAIENYEKKNFFSK